MSSWNPADPRTDEWYAEQRRLKKEAGAYLSKWREWFELSEAEAATAAKRTTRGWLNTSRVEKVESSGASWVTAKNIVAAYADYVAEKTGGPLRDGRGRYVHATQMLPAKISETYRGENPLHNIIPGRTITIAGAYSPGWDYSKTDLKKLLVPLAEAGAKFVIYLRPGVPVDAAEILAQWRPVVITAAGFCDDLIARDPERIERVAEQVADLGGTSVRWRYASEYRRFWATAGMQIPHVVAAMSDVVLLVRPIVSNRFFDPVFYQRPVRTVCATHKPGCCCLEFDQPVLPVAGPEQIVKMLRF